MVFHQMDRRTSGRWCARDYERTLFKTKEPSDFLKPAPDLTTIEAAKIDIVR